jgi:outer membrane protein TolC
MLPAGARAQAPPQAGATVRLTLPDAVERALSASHRVGEATARQEAADAAVASRSAADLPTVSVLAGYTRTNHVDEFAIPGAPGSSPRVIYPDVPDNWRSRIDLQWPVYTFGRTAAMERAARADAAAVANDVLATKADTRLDATRAFWALVTATESVRVVEDALALVEAHLRDVKNRLDVGLVAPNDVLSAEAQRSRERVLLIEARNARNVAEADLRRVTGISADVAIALDARLDGPLEPMPTHDRLIAEARLGRPERQGIAARISGLAGRRDAVAAGLKPTVLVGAGFDYARPNPRIFPRAAAWNESWDVGVSLAWPLWDGGRVKADTAEVSASQRALERRLAEFDTVLEFEVRQRRLDLESVRAAIEAANDGVAAAAEARRVVAERFAAGLVSNTDVLAAQQALLAAQFDRTRVLASARMAQARLDRAVGR